MQGMKKLVLEGYLLPEEKLKMDVYGDEKIDVNGNVNGSIQYIDVDKSIQYIDVDGNINDVNENENINNENVNENINNESIEEYKIGIFGDVNEEDALQIETFVKKCLENRKDIKNEGKDIQVDNVKDNKVEEVSVVRDRVREFLEYGKRYINICEGSDGGMDGGDHDSKVCLDSVKKDVICSDGGIDEMDNNINDNSKVCLNDDSINDNNSINYNNTIDNTEVCLDNNRTDKDKFLFEHSSEHNNTNISNDNTTTNTTLTIQEFELRKQSLINYFSEKHKNLKDFSLFAWKLFINEIDYSKYKSECIRIISEMSVNDIVSGLDGDVYEVYVV
ncbi:hypothetical protein NAPIS_ORF02412 [Vairimorpha apis BRL 01]|uniref:Uncharacterized protein n=1 Tax=Vairimorpha apis BRL 01 TaxID=1037528 RepID=T0M9H0_9MICR|nr:hypothetical protein NAPIS_ORF02412 [Vairimorpha apis BRL 01]